MELQKQLVEWINLEIAFQNASRGKRGRKATAVFEFYLADNLLHLQQELQQKTYLPSGYKSFYIHEPKRRLISAAPFRDRVVHHALCNITTGFFEKRFIFDSYANRMGKGTHRALDRCTQFARRFKYVLQCDVRQFFPSTDHEIMYQTLKSMLPDKSIMWLVERILQSGQGILSEEYKMVFFRGDDLFAVHRPRGLPIGNLTSQWWANCYLNPFDQFVKRELSCAGYLRYVDDFLLFSDNKRELMNWRKEIIERLKSFRLTVHEESAYPKPVVEGIPFLGFIIFPTHRRLKSRKGYAFRRRLWHMQRSGMKEKIEHSVPGWLNHIRYGDTLGLRKSLLNDANLLAQDALCLKI